MSLLLRGHARTAQSRAITSRRWKSSGPSPTVTDAAKASTSAAQQQQPQTKSRVVLEAERQVYLREANEQMKLYHDTRELMRQGKLKNVNAHLGPRHAGQTQAAVAVVFLAILVAMPFLGRKIARDDDFRQRWVPKWYDYTVQKPDKPWTRQELHEQYLMVQMHLRERAMKGDFAPEKLDQLQTNLEGQVQKPGGSSSPSSPSSESRSSNAWDIAQPGMSPDEEYNES